MTTIACFIGFALTAKLGQIPLGGGQESIGTALLRGHDLDGKNVFSGRMSSWRFYGKPLSKADGERMTSVRMNMPLEMRPFSANFSDGFTVTALITPDRLETGTMFEYLTADKKVGFLFDTFPGDGLRLMVGDVTLKVPKCLAVGATHHVAASFDPKTGEAAIYLDEKQVAYRKPTAGAG